MTTDREVIDLVPELRAKRLPLAPVPSLPDEQSNLRAKKIFRALVLRVLGRRSIREQALFFGVPHSTYNERISGRRGDLAPLDAWTAKLERHADWQRGNAEFARTA